MVLLRHRVVIVAFNFYGKLTLQVQRCDRLRKVGTGFVSDDAVTMDGVMP